MYKIKNWTVIWGWDIHLLRIYGQNILQELIFFTGTRSCKIKWTVRYCYRTTWENWGTVVGMWICSYLNVEDWKTVMFFGNCTGCPDWWRGWCHCFWMDGLHASIWGNFYCCLLLPFEMHTVAQLCACFLVSNYDRITVLSWKPLMR